MKKRAYLWIVETKSGAWKHWITTNRTGPTPNRYGFLSLDGKDYTIDMRKCRPWTFKKWRFMVQIWKEDAPTPVPLFDAGEDKTDFTASIINRMSKLKRLELIESEGWDITKIALILSLAINALVVMSLVL